MLLQIFNFDRNQRLSSGYYPTVYMISMPGADILVSCGSYGISLQHSQETALVETGSAEQSRNGIQEEHESTTPAQIRLERGSEVQT